MAPRTQASTAQANTAQANTATAPAAKASSGKASAAKAGATKAAARKRPAAKTPVVGIIMGSRSDWPTMKNAADMLKALGVPHETKVVSAHRTPDRLWDYAKGAKARGLSVIVAGAGGAAHLPGMVASMTTLPVLGVPVESRSLNGMDSLLSIVQMPGGIPVGTLAIGAPGAKNAGILAASIVALQDAGVARRLEAWRAKQTADVPDRPTGR